MSLSRSKTRSIPVCHWCKAEIDPEFRMLTSRRHSNWPDLPAGVRVVVCADDCPEKPEGAPVASPRRKAMT